MTTQDRVNGGRPGDVPEDVLATAEDRYLDAVVMTTEDEPRAIVIMIARAIVTERERCAKIAESHGGRIRLGGFIAWHGASNIAAAIRKGGA